MYKIFIWFVLLYHVGVCKTMKVKMSFRPINYLCILGLITVQLQYYLLQEWFSSHNSSTLKRFGLSINHGILLECSSSRSILCGVKNGHFKQNASATDIDALKRRFFK